MQENPFKVLGVSDSVTQNELYEAYKIERGKYIDKRFSPGEEGAQACAALDKIEAAYKEADDVLKSRYNISNFDTAYKDIEEMIKQGKVDDAQSELDKKGSRDAEWHFLQSMIYYRKRWYNEAREQLKTAAELDPANTRYKDALDKLNNRYGENSERHSFYNASTRQDDRSYRNTDADRGNARATGCTPCDVCSSLICADCCCECMGGDLISCC
jgi:Tetratricopeptide repeat.